MIRREWRRIRSVAGSGIDSRFKLFGCTTEI
jgi:hypothetical protein